MLHIALVDGLVSFRPESLRATILAGKVDLQGIELKEARRMRNHLEHYDERLDNWIAKNRGKPFFDTNVITGAVGFPHEKALRALDGDKLYFTGESYLLPELLEAICRLDERLSALDT